MDILGKDYLLVTLDFETFYAPKYSLTTMNTFTYVDDPRFSIHGVGIRIDDDSHQWFRDTQAALDHIDARNVDDKPIALLCHNGYFDGWILHRCFDWHADLYLDTMGMSRGLFPTERARLESLCERLWPNDKNMRKGKELIQFKGTTTEQLWANPALEQTMSRYCIGDGKKQQGDVGLTHAAFMRMLPHYPDHELRIIDLTLRMMCDPVLTIDVPRVIECRDKAVIERDALIKASKLPEKLLSSNAQFERWVIANGMTVPMKDSPTVMIKDADGNDTDQPALIPALGKADLGFLELRRSHPEHEHVWAGRVAAKSVGEITRAERFIATAEQCDGFMPVALIYYSAHTGRYGGGEKLNLQNLGRGSELRRSLCVPTRRIAA
jgi:DNA polymerase